MFLTPGKLIPKNFLGIDIGTSVIRVVELSRWGNRIKLENYGEIESKSLYEMPFRTFEKTALLLSDQDISRAVRGILRKAKIKTKKAIFAIPDFSTFYTTFEMPQMTDEELAQAVKFEARQYIPLPLSEVVLDWSVVNRKDLKKAKRKGNFKVLLVAVPNEVIRQYQEIAKYSNLKLLAVEAEAFGLVRALVKEDKRIIALVDIGAQSTTASIIDDGVLKLSHSFDMSGNNLTHVLTGALSIDYKEAEELKSKYGINPSKENIRDVIIPLIDLILSEIKKISQSFYRSEGKAVQKVILSGGTAFLPGLKEYFSQQLKRDVDIADPFKEIFYPPILENILKEKGSSYAVAIGMALRGFE